MSGVEGGENGEQHRFAVSRRLVEDTAPTPSKIMGLLARIRHPNGAVNHDHPDIKDVMDQAKKDKLDVMVIARGNGIDAVAGRFLANDHNRLVKIGAGVAISTVIAAGAIGFILRKHKR